MNEKTFQTKFTKWLKYNWIDTARFELKITKTASFSLGQLKPHQRVGLKVAFPYKIPDSDMSQKPFDCFYMKKTVKGYLVLQFYKRGVKRFYIININDLEKYESTLKKKSITEQQASAICILYADFA
jgi:penicillin-binding protein-related factor A (putative recombinase)